MSEARQMPTLVCSDGQEITISGILTIGRSPDCTLPLEDGSVSRLHAQLEVLDQRVVLTDLGSRNGTWLNDRKVTAPTELHDGDRLRISKTVYVFKAASVPAPAVKTPKQKSATPKKKSATVYWQTDVPLTLVRSDNAAEFGLNRNITIGRDKSSDLMLKGDSSASASHARVELVGGQAFISDLKSSNGTWVNGKRISSPTPLKHGDRIRVGNAVFRLRVGERPLPPLDAASLPAKTTWQRWGWSLIVTSIVILGAIVTVLILGGFFVWPQIKANMQSAGMKHALRALVIVVVPIGDVQTTETASIGSGSLLNEQGYLLTNYHVLADPETGQYYNSEMLIAIGLNWDDPESEPDTFYRCNIVSLDTDLDLALLRVTATERGNALPDNLAFPFIRVGNSDKLAMGYQITIIGFPGTGGTTPTFTNGVVSGFYPDGDLERGWLKTDAEISSGNSGGMAINQDGELIGIPTVIVAGEEFLGKIGYVRPINLALPLIQAYLP